MNNAMEHCLHEILVLKWKNCTLLTRATSKKIDGFSFCLCLDSKIAVKEKTMLNLCFFSEWLRGLWGKETTWWEYTILCLNISCIVAGEGEVMWTSPLFLNLSWIQIIQKDVLLVDSSLCQSSEWSLGVRHKALVWDTRLLLELVDFSCKEKNQLHEWGFKQNRMFYEQFKSRSREK